MRKLHVVYGYAAALLLFEAAVLWAADVPPAVVALAVGFGVVFLGVMLAIGSRVRRIVLVGERPDDRVPEFHARLDGKGLELLECGGPSNRPCPVSFGGTCPVADPVTAAVIFRHPDEASRPLAPCGMALHVPSLVVEEGSDRSPEIVPGYARVGGARPLGDTLYALEVITKAA